MERQNFDALRDMHNSANDLLHSPLTKQALVSHRQDKWVFEVSEASLRMLDVCGISKDVLLLVKEHLQDFQFTLRRMSIGGTEPSICNKIAAYSHIQKKLKKELTKCLHGLKAKKEKSVISGVMDQNLMVVVEVLKEVKVMIICIVESLLSLISVPWIDRKSNKGSFTSKLMRMSGQVSACDMWSITELQSADKRLDTIEFAIEDLEIELECMFRRLIQTRVSLLNILTT